MKICCIDGCGRKNHAKGYCNSCYAKQPEIRARLLVLNRVRRKKTENADTKKYEKTPNGFLMRTYRNMVSRVTGVQWKKHHLYEGKDILSKEDFYKWSADSDAFMQLFVEWSNLGYPRRLSPSIDRVNPDLGYTLDNMRWVPFYVNCSTTRRHLKAAALEPTPPPLSDVPE